MVWPIVTAQNMLRKWQVRSSYLQGLKGNPNNNVKEQTSMSKM